MPYQESKISSSEQVLALLNSLPDSLNQEVAGLSDQTTETQDMMKLALSYQVLAEWLAALYEAIEQSEGTLIPLSRALTPSSPLREALGLSRIGQLFFMGKYSVPTEHMALERLLALLEAGTFLDNPNVDLREQLLDVSVPISADDRPIGVLYTNISGVQLAVERQPDYPAWKCS